MKYFCRKCNDYTERYKPDKTKKIGGCKSCSKRRYLDNQEAIKKRSRENGKLYRKNNKERESSRTKAWYEANKEVVSAKSKNRRNANREEVNRKCREYYRRKVEESPEYYQQQSMARKASKLKRTPKWLTEADYSEMLSIYKECNKISKETGISHEVDHIYPLRGKMVSGLHVPSNLQILTQAENRSKGNR